MTLKSIKSRTEHALKNVPDGQYIVSLKCQKLNGHYHLQNLTIHPLQVLGKIEFEGGENSAGKRSLHLSWLDVVALDQKIAGIQSILSNLAVKKETEIKHVCHRCKKIAVSACGQVCYSCLDNNYRRPETCQDGPQLDK